MTRTAALTTAALALLACARHEPLAPPTIVDFSYANAAQVVTTHLDLDLDVDFDRRVIAGTATFDLDHRKDANVIYFDTWALRVLEVTADGKKTRWTLGDSLPLVGRPLSVAITPATRRVAVRYETIADAAGSGVQWLTAAQTAGKAYPYVYTQSQSIHARSWVPCQDTPSIRFTYSARVRVPSELMAVMSAHNAREKSEDGVYQFEMKQTLPSYLLALAVGDIEYRSIGPRSGVYAEPGVVEAAVSEFADLEKMIDTAESLLGPYRWEQYDVLVLPPSFPYGGMENPRLTFVTPVLLAGDRSLVSVITHELSHSWSGNLVTNATWNDFWLNEGFTTYFERRLDEALYGKEYTDMQVMLGKRDLDGELADRGRGNKDTALYIELAGRDPDEVMGSTPYEKGYFFLRMLEESFGRETFDAFLRRYFDTHAFQTMTTERFVAFMKQDLFANDEARYVSLRVDEWIYQPGLPSNAPVAHSTRFDQVDAQIAAFVKGAPAKQLVTRGWTTNEWQRFLDNLPQPLPAPRLADLDRTYHLSNANAVVQRSWFPNVIAARYQPAYPALENFLMTIGRRYLVRPVYQKLAETPDGMEFARRVYAQARPGYHSLTANGIDPLLGWPWATDTTTP
jgi:leukotriene-A4 hydrolase